MQNNNVKYKTKIRIGLATIVAIMLVVISYCWYMYLPNTQKVYEEFSTDKKLALEHYNNLSDSNKEKVQSLITNEINSKYEKNEDYYETREVIDRYDNITDIKSYVDLMRDKTDSRMFYLTQEDEIKNKNINFANEDIHSLNHYKEKYKLVKDFSEYYEVAQKRIKEIEKEIPRAEKQDVEIWKEVVGIDMSNLYDSTRDKSTNKQPQIEMSKTEKPRIGMSKSEILNSSWGRPKDINKTTTKYGVREQWVYSGNRYLYFENEILTTIQE